MTQALLLKLLNSLWPYIAACIIGAGAAGWVQQIRIKSVKVDLRACMAANEANQASIKSLEKEVIATRQGCDSRLTIKEKTLATLKRVDGLKGASGTKSATGKQNTTGEKVNEAIDGNNPLLDGLNRMYTPSRADHEN